MPRLSIEIADFARRGFRTDRPAARSRLEGSARAFVDGFNVGMEKWRDPHQALAQRGDEVTRGFSYEGAAMAASLVDLASAGTAGAMSRLLSGPGQRYVHLIHVGAGWQLTPSRLPVRPLLPATPLVRWLALDGHGFARAFFGGERLLRRYAARAGGPRRQIALAGQGRALWFTQAGDPHGIQAVLSSVPPAARPHLWSGVGLALTYAGGASEAECDRLVEAAGPHRYHLGQGVVFGATARAVAGAVPAWTDERCCRILGVDPLVATRWSQDASAGLATSRGVWAYMEWRARLRRRLAQSACPLTP